ncbi:hypothetical protein HY404_03500 [Candidatus Microgenomates bacterium]|nr:hypothetical protein [Candidatus Microgenomates bacterium]
MAITLLPQTFGNGREVLQAKQLQKVATVFLAIYLAGALVAGGYFFFVIQKQNKLKAAYEITSSEVAKLKEQESAHVLLKDRVANLLRRLAQKGLTFTQGLVLTNNLVAVSGVELVDLTTASDKIRLTIAAPNTATLGKFIDNLSADKEINAVSLDSITRAKEGIYNSQVTLTLQNETK